jgi:hypothetical protein
MLEYITHDRLTKIINEQPPYRGRTGEQYPYYKRSHGQKYFIPRNNMGGTYYDVYYYKNKLLTIHPNNIVEFHSDYYGQGETGILKDLTKGWFCNNKARGGYIYTKTYEENYTIILPIKNGIKYDMITDEPITKYDVVTKQVDRKASTKLIQDHAWLFKSTNTWLNAVDDEDFIPFVMETTALTHAEYGTWRRSDKYSSVLKDLYDKKDYIGFAVACASRMDNFANLNKHSFTRFYDKPKVMSWIIESMKKELWDIYDTYNNKIIPCELRYIPTNKKIEIKLRGE